MEIDLAKVLAYSNGGMQSRTQMRSIMMDMYPGKTRDINVLLSVYESGIPKKIKNDGKINEAQYAAYIKKIADDYGLKEVYISKALNAWIDICIGLGTAESLHLIPPDDADFHSGLYTRPIVHTPVITKSASVVGRATDYEITAVGRDIIEISKFVGFDQEDTIIPTEIENKKVIGIGENAFHQCKGIKRLIVPEGIEYIRDGAFDGCSNLVNVILPTTLKQLGSIDDKRRAIIHRPGGVFAGTSISEIDLPNQVKRIPDRCFSNCKNLRKVQFPDELESIGWGAFRSDEKITEICLPGTVQTIEGAAFSDCKMLSRAILNEGLKFIGGNAFGNCSDLKEIIIPSTVDSFGSDIFKCGYGGNKTIIVKCYPGSRAIEYARTNNLQIANACV